MRLHDYTDFVKASDWTKDHSDAERLTIARYGIASEIGSLAAVYCLEQRGPQSHSYTREEFINRFRCHFDDGGKLDALLN